jgi:rhodanese-related sulfurtransferase
VHVLHSKLRRRPVLAGIAVVATLGLAGACGSDTSDDASQPDPAPEAVAPSIGADQQDDAPPASEPLTAIDVDQLNEAIETTPDLQVVDVRTAEEVATGTIPGSVNIPHDVIDAGNTEGLDLEAPIAAICRSGRRATIAGEALVEAGAADVRVVVPGGVETYAQAGYPTVVP